MDKYPEIKRNIIKKFLNPLYRYTTVNDLEFVVKDMNKRVPFNVIFTKSDSILTIELGDNITVFVKIVIDTPENGSPKFRIKNFE